MIDVIPGGMVLVCPICAKELKPIIQTDEVYRSKFVCESCHVTRACRLRNDVRYADGKIGPLTTERECDYPKSMPVKCDGCLFWSGRQLRCVHLGGCPQE